MGSWFSRKQKTTSEVLDQIEKDLNHLESYRKHTEFSQKQAVGHLMVFAVVLYLGTAFMGYFYYYPAYWQQALVRLLPFLLFPLLILFIKWALCWFFARRLERNDEKMSELRQERKEILDNVKDRETYKVAKEILEKYDPTTKLEKAEKERMEKEKEQREMIRRLSPAPTLRQRNVQRQTPTPQQQRKNLGPSPSLDYVPNRPVSALNTHGPPPDLTSPLPEMMTSGRASIGPIPMMVGAPPGSMPSTPRVTARPILPKDRTPMDKFVDYLLGDGPSNRFALICSQCHAHNGMALREDFEYLAFRCCYCFAFNPARKQRPLLPKTELFPSPPITHQPPQGRSISVANLSLDRSEVLGDGSSSSTPSDHEQTPQGSEKGDDDEDVVPDPEPSEVESQETQKDVSEQSSQNEPKEQ